MLNSLFKRSGYKVLMWTMMAWLITNIPIWAEMIQIDEPWDEIITKGLAFLVGLLKLWRMQITEPSVDAMQLPSRVIADMPLQDKKTVLHALEKQMDRQT